MDHQYLAALLAAVKTNEDEWELRVRQCGRRILTAVTFRESARSTCEKMGSTLLPVIGYYYSLFHVSVAVLYFEHTTKCQELEHLKHGTLRHLVQDRLVNPHLLSRDIMKLHAILLDLRETANYSFGGKAPPDLVQYWERVPKLYDETAPVFEECIATIHALSEVVDKGLGKSRALGTWIDDGIGNDTSSNYLSRSDAQLVSKFLEDHQFYA
jgi:hypothetical protein